MRAGLKLYGLTVRFWTKSYGQTVRFRAAAYGQTVRSPSSASAVGAKILRCFNPGYLRAAAKKRTPHRGGYVFGARVQRIDTAWCPLDNLKEILKVYSNRYEKLTLSSHMDILGADRTDPYTSLCAGTGTGR